VDNSLPVTPDIIPTPMMRAVTAWRGEHSSDRDSDDDAHGGQQQQVRAAMTTDRGQRCSSEDSEWSDAKGGWMDDDE
jgi:hypothetical protein